MASIPTFEIFRNEQASFSALAVWREAVASFFDVEPLSDDFTAALTSYSLGNLLIGQAQASAQIFRRTEDVIQRSRVDHILIQYYLDGSFTGSAEALSIAVEPGDICCFDLAFGFWTEATDFSNLSMVIPKSALQPLTTGDQFHGLVLKSGEVSNRLLGAHMRELLLSCSTLEDTDIDAVTQVTIELARLCLRMPSRKRLAPSARPGSLVERARSFIGENLGDPNLDSIMICQAFAISRATLYRHFAPLGGVASVIRNWRLSTVFSELEADRNEPLHAIARRNGFASESACARAFKARYGLSPSSLRALRLERSETSDRPPTQISKEGKRPDLTRWLRDLGRK